MLVPLPKTSDQDHFSWHQERFSGTSILIEFYTECNSGWSKHSDDQRHAPDCGKLTDTPLRHPPCHFRLQECHRALAICRCMYNIAWICNVYRFVYLAAACYEVPGGNTLRVAAHLLQRLRDERCGCCARGGGACAFDIPQLCRLRQRLRGGPASDARAFHGFLWAC